MPDESLAETAYSVLTIDAVRRAIAELKRHRIHEQFPVYLRVRQQALATGTRNPVDADMNGFKHFFQVPDGPPNKPFYRPFASADVTSDAGFWKGKNQAGSFAPSSIRDVARFLLDDDRKDFVLPPAHAETALRKLLFERPVPAWAFGGFFLRNYGFDVDPDAGREVLVESFRQVFRFGDDGDFETLFTVNPSPELEWFELYQPTSGEGV
ncbi:hypothetical protein ACPCUX_14845 [Cellulosimicrobium sp. AB352]|uniref:hypothetical protein n=1 Tax=Cellulosimicrobium sp. AB352 TaxID=3413281 RepID=UPI003C173066